MVELGSISNIHKVLWWHLVSELHRCIGCHLCCAWACKYRLQGLRRCFVKSDPKYPGAGAAKRGHYLVGYQTIDEPEESGIARVQHVPHLLHEAASRPNTMRLPPSAPEALAAASSTATQLGCPRTSGTPCRPPWVGTTVHVQQRQSNRLCLGLRRNCQHQQVRYHRHLLALRVNVAVLSRIAETASSRSHTMVQRIKFCKARNWLGIPSRCIASQSSGPYDN